MIRGIHGLFYTSQPEQLRAFIRDKLQLPFTDVHDGWLIFDFEEGDLGVHPTDPEDGSLSGAHDISFFTDDLVGTVRELEGRGVRFDDAIADRGYGRVIHLTMPGGVKVQLYEPRYQKRRAKKATRKRPAKKKTARRAPDAARMKPAAARGRVTKKKRARR